MIVSAKFGAALDEKSNKRYLSVGFFEIAQNGEKILYRQGERWFIAPLEVLGSESGVTVIVIIIVLFFAGGAFAVLDKPARSAPSSAGSYAASVSASTPCCWQLRSPSCSWAQRSVPSKRLSCWCRS
jgi:hypothetical protein